MNRDICANFVNDKCTKGISEECKHDCPEHTPWIFESPDKGKTVFRRRFGDHDSPREKIKG